MTHIQLWKDNQIGAAIYPLAEQLCLCPREVGFRTEKKTAKRCCVHLVFTIVKYQILGLDGESTGVYSPSQRGRESTRQLRPKCSSILIQRFVRPQFCCFLVGSWLVGWLDLVEGGHWGRLPSSQLAQQGSPCCCCCCC